MSGVDAFFDTNVVRYLLSEDEVKADCAEGLLTDGGVISVQVLNEFAVVASRELRMSWLEIREALNLVRAVCQVHPMSVGIHQRALQVAERYGLSFYDAFVVSSALLAGCKTLYPEDMQDGQVIERQMKVPDPFGKL